MSKVFYRYMRANLETLKLLYDDALYFSTPDLFNDPFDSNPTLELDVDTEILDKIYRELLIRRIIVDGASNALKEAITKIGDARLSHAVADKFIRDANHAYEAFQEGVEISFSDDEEGKSEEEHRRFHLKYETKN